MRAAPAILLALTLSACGGGTKSPTASAPPTTAAPTTASPTPTAPAIEVVKAALSATRAKGTATFTIEATTSLGDAGHMTMNREGAYDLKAKRTKVTQSFAAEPRSLADQLLGEEGAIDALVMHSLNDAGVAYLQMPAWPASIRSKWLRFGQGDISAATGFEVSLEQFPAPLEMLAQAKATNVPTFGNTYYVSVPAPAVVRATPGLSSVKALTDAGVDIDALTGSVQVGVDVVGGVITAVRFDAIEVFRQAWTKAKQTQLGQLVKSVETIVTVSDHGAPAAITIPPAGLVMTQQEFEAAF